MILRKKFPYMDAKQTEGIIETLATVPPNLNAFMKSTFAPGQGKRKPSRTKKLQIEKDIEAVEAVEAEQEEQEDQA